MDQSERIKHAMALAGVSTAQVASCCGISVQAAYKWQNNPAINLKSDHLFTFSDLTGFNARWIATGRGPERGQAEDEIGLLTHYRNASEEGQQAILRVAESLSTAYEPRKYADPESEKVKQITNETADVAENANRLPDADQHTKTFTGSDRRRKKTADG